MKKNSTKYIILIGVFGFIVIGGIYQLLINPLLTSYYLNIECRYGITSSIGSLKAGSRFGRYTHEYLFLVRDVEYNGEYDNVYLKGQHYFIKFYPSNPNYNKMSFVKASKIDIDSMPVDGYTVLPHK